MNSSIFHKDWWLEAVAPRRWRKISVAQGGQVVASLPIVRYRRLGLNLIKMPPYTQFLGPWIAARDREVKYPTYISRQKEWLTQLITQIPKSQYFAQSFHPSITNWLPFYWQGFRSTVRYTYVLENIKDPEKVRLDLSDNIRRDIRKSEAKLIVETTDEVSELVEMCNKSFKRLNRPSPFSSSSLKRLHHACLSNESGRIILARDGKDRIHAAMMYVWDEKCTRYVLGGGDPELRNSGAQSLLMWSAILHAIQLNQTFDFEGSMIEPVERYVRAFGGKQTPYLYITRYSPLTKFLCCIR